MGSDDGLVRALHAAGDRPDRTHFARFVAALPRPVGRLGLTHVTTGFILRDIAEAERIVASAPCRVLKEPLVYAFYGRSAFRRRGDEKASDLSFMFPVALVVDPAKAPAPRHVFAFDSGAFMKGFMDDFLDPGMPLFDFHVEPDVSSAAAIAQYFFGSSEAFLQNSPAVLAQPPESAFEAQIYRKLIQAGSAGSNQLDDRSTTPELLFDEIPVRDAVRAAILPHVLAADPEIGEALEKLGVRLLPYEWKPGTRPSEWHGVIRGHVEGLYKEFGWGHHTDG